MPFPTLPEALKKALDNKGYTEPTPVQNSILTQDIAGRDLLVSARTGSGKTIAFGLAIADVLLVASQKPKALIIAPTRELALQVARELIWLYGYTPNRVVACVGGMDPRREARDLYNGASIVVGTPGRLCDHLDRGNLDLSEVSAVVLDEGDEMLDMGFKDELEHLLDAVPKERRTLLFSATMPPGIEALAKKYQNNALKISTADTTQPHADITWRAMLVSQRERDHAVINLLLAEDPPGALVFCATREEVARMHGALQEHGFSAVILSGDLTQAERSRALWALRDGRARVLVATDVAARGLDLPALDLVIHADLPRDAATLVHRSGRTGRAGRAGMAVILSPFSRRRVAERLLGDAKLRVDWERPPDSVAIEGKVAERLLAELEGLPAGEVEDVELGKRLLEKLGAEAIAGLLVRSIRSHHPEPEDLPETYGTWAKFEKSPERKAERKPVRSSENYMDKYAAKGKPRADGPAYSEGSEGPQEGAPKPGKKERKAEKGGKGSFGSGPTWFKVNIGKNDGVEVRWLIPLICRRGGVQKKDIGEIRVQNKDTVFEITAFAAERFAEQSQERDKRSPGVFFTRAKFDKPKADK